VPTAAQLDSAMILAGQRELALGWTQVQDAHGTWAEVERMRRLLRSGELKLRLYKAITAPGREADQLIAQGPGAPELDDHLQVRVLKFVMDGALGSRGAALLEPYSDDQLNRGLVTVDTVAMRQTLERALRAGIQVETHAIGDRANRMTLDMYAAALKAVPPAQRKVKEPRWRIEHSQIVNPADIPRFKQLGIIASMQPSHAIGDLFFAASRLGTARLKGAYAWESFLKLGVPVAGGTDAPVERGEPMIEFYAAVARKSLDGRSGTPDVWHTEERVTRTQALKMFTWFPAFAAFEEDRHGSIAVGKSADFTVLDQDIMTIPDAQIPRTKNVLTIISGQVVYQSK
ncbi:MAG: amidohydrolase family protein, partial [Gemmatimonadota bacterium]